MTTKDVVNHLGKMVGPGYSVTGPDFCRHVRAYMSAHLLFPLPMDTSIMRRLRESQLFDRINPTDPRNKDHHHSFYIRRKR